MFEKIRATREIKTISLVLIHVRRYDYFNSARGSI